MQLSIPTLVTLLLSSIIAPWFEQHDIALTAAQQAKLGDWITAGLVLVATAAVHLIHGKVKAVRAAKLLAAYHGATGQKAPAADPIPSTPSPKKIGPLSLKAVVLLPFAGLLVAMLASCALLANPTFDALLQAAIQAVVSAVVAKNPSAGPILLADAQTLSAAASGNTTGAQLQQSADAVVAASALSAGDKQAIEDIVAAVAGPGGLTQAQIAGSDANTKAALSLVFDDIANAAQLATQTNPAPASARIAGASGSVLNDINDAAGQLHR